LQAARTGRTLRIFCARDRSKGDAAVKSILSSTAQGQIDVLVVDVGNQASVQSAAESLAERGVKLLAIVNNAGVMARGASDVALQTNVYGTVRVCNAFMPLLADHGRVVNVSSAAGPWFLEKAPAKVQAALTNPQVSWEQIDEHVQTQRLR